MPTNVNAVEFALSKWSIAVQGGVIFILLVFFALSWITTKRKVLLTWSLAWIMDLTALLLVYQAAGADIVALKTHLFYVGYGVSKLLYVFFLVLGLYQYRRASFAMGEMVPRWLIWGLLSWAALLILLRVDAVQAQLMVYAAVVLLLSLAGIDTLFREKSRGARLLAFVLLMDGAWFLHHSLVLLPHLWGAEIPGYMSHISFADAISEFTVGLACLLAAGLRVMDEVWEANKKLEASQGALRNLVDADPLTGLYNRRKFRSFMEDASQQSGILIFLDVDRFKSVNDNWGHGAGDACLRRVADTMRSVFRSEDGLFRMGGDEFLVVAFGLSVADANERVTRLREILIVPDENGIPVSVSAGLGEFGKGKALDEVLAFADSAMYEDKAFRRRDSSASIRIRSRKAGSPGKQ
ncbi:MAG: GGDEF domain-containing protein [Acidobacteria bacterium]|nr:GGDEF domain-containing protein [Acidobacteriota bacterium]